jgi:hypothetical protein
VCTSGRRGGCKASATVRLVCTGWRSRHDALAMRQLLRQDATDEGAGVLVRRFPAVASLDLKCCCLNALTDEGMRAVSSLTVLTSLELWGCSKVTDERMRAVSSLAGLTCRHSTRQHCRILLSCVQRAALSHSAGGSRSSARPASPYIPTLCAGLMGKAPTSGSVTLRAGTRWTSGACSEWWRQQAVALGSARVLCAGMRYQKCCPASTRRCGTGCNSVTRSRWDRQPLCG